MPMFRTDAALWYNNGIFGDLGYAVPNVGDNVDTLNSTIAILVEAVGRNVSATMHLPDADLPHRRESTCLKTFANSCCVAGKSLKVGAVAPGVKPFEATHATPARRFSSYSRYRISGCAICG